MFVDTSILFILIVKSISICFIVGFLIFAMKIRILPPAGIEAKLTISIQTL